MVMVRTHSNMMAEPMVWLVLARRRVWCSTAAMFSLLARSPEPSMARILSSLI